MKKKGEPIILESSTKDVEVDIRDNFEDMNTACLLDCDGILFLVNNYSENSSMVIENRWIFLVFWKNQGFTRKTLILISHKYIRKLCANVKRFKQSFTYLLRAHFWKLCALTKSDKSI